MIFTVSMELLKITVKIDFFVVAIEEHANTAAVV